VLHIYIYDISRLRVKVNILMCMKRQLVLTCNEKTRSAGMGMIAAAKNANMLLSAVRRMLSPVLLSTTPVCSYLEQ
jgi:hypothetical protein